jgi:hydroxymethylpyrimidine pyrophosphatase-like HAD family hydrolase
MARRLRRIVSLVLSYALVAASAGFDARLAVAQTFSGRGATVSPVAQIGLGVCAAPAPTVAPTALALSAPLPSAESLAISAPTIAEAIVAAAPVLQALARPETGASAASVAGRDLEGVLTGERPASSFGDFNDVVAGFPSALVPALSAPSTVSEGPTDAVVPAAVPAPFKTIGSASSYRFHRLALKAVAVLTGAVFTLPQAGPALTAKIIASAADKSLVLSDFDDTLAGYNEVLPAEKVAAIAAIRKAGKHFAVISDRSDVKRGAQLTLFESLESIPAQERAGMYVAANSGGKVYRYDDQGVPQKVHEAAGLSDAQNAALREAAAATKARLHEVGAVQHVDDGKNPGESFNTYGYALMLKLGSSNEAVKATAVILNEELAKRGFEVEVQPRFAKSPENPPYVAFSIITKADAAAYIAGALKIEAKDALVIGDAMFIPREAKKPSALSRLGERLSGRPQAKTGNASDRNMTKLLPGVLALGVGAAMDPRVPNGWALDGHGPALTQRVLESVAAGVISDKGRPWSATE